MTVQKWLLQSEPGAVGPHKFLGQRFVVSGLGHETRKIRARTQRGWSDSDFEALVDSPMRVEYFVTRIAYERSRHGREPELAVRRSNQRRDKKIVQRRVLEVITKYDGLGLLGIEILLHLEAGVCQGCGKDRILTAVLDRRCESRSVTAAEK